MQFGEGHQSQQPPERVALLLVKIWGSVALLWGCVMREAPLAIGVGLARVAADAGALASRSQRRGGGTTAVGKMKPPGLGRVELNPEERRQQGR